MKRKKMSAFEKKKALKLIELEMRMSMLRSEFFIVQSQIDPKKLKKKTWAKGGVITGNNDIKSVTIETDKHYKNRVKKTFPTTEILIGEPGKRVLSQKELKQFRKKMKNLPKTGPKIKCNCAYARNINQSKRSIDDFRRQYRDFKEKGIPMTGWNYHA